VSAQSCFPVADYDGSVIIDFSFSFFCMPITLDLLVEFITDGSQLI